MDNLAFFEIIRFQKCYSLLIRFYLLMNLKSSESVASFIVVISYWRNFHANLS